MYAFDLSLIHALVSLIETVAKVVIPFEIFLLIIIKNKIFQREILINLSCASAIYISSKLVDFSFIYRSVDYIHSFALIKLNTEHLGFYNAAYFLAHILIGDLCFYLFHRLAHTKIFFLLDHSTHHSSTELNFTTNLRINPIAGFYAWLPITIPALLGFNPALLFASFALANAVPFFLHRENTRKLGWLEYIFNTPTHHKVHHGSNLCYLNKNFGGMLIIWDRLFGTFADESEPVTLGIKGKIPSSNPLEVMFKGWYLLWKSILANLKKMTRFTYQMTVDIKQNNDIPASQRGRV
jgi:sterol desaturase/sphingolipid hydroxylase (fatty acid hydroxylase superfamily)